LIVVLRRIPLERLLGLVNELADEGARMFEITMDSDEAAAAIVGVRTALRGRAVVGAGTIRSPAQLGAAIKAEAAFGVAPALSVQLVAAAVDAGLPFIPGVATPTEAELAWAAGATFVKLFPASSIGPAFVRELRGPMPEIEFICTGGISLETARSFLEHGAVAVGLGTAIVNAAPDQRRALISSLRAPD
jgi:2-dehydro-3-deoxyphosphogluconate aldolase/(4S)-4-hydroxy-2-oxoglutarate aldolase